MTPYKWIATIALVAAWSVSGLAQTDQGKLRGTVRDQSNAFVAGAKVTVKNERTGQERTTISNDQGFFLIDLLRPSTYTIRVEKDGFGPTEYTALPLAVGQELALDFELRPAGVQESITVTATSPIVDMSSARMPCESRGAYAEVLVTRREPGAGPKQVLIGIARDLSEPDLRRTFSARLRATVAQ